MTEEDPMQLIPAKQSDAPTTSALGKVGAFVAIVAVLAFGVFAMGRAAANDQVAMLLTAAWFGGVLVAGYMLVRRRRDLWLPLGVGFALSSIAVTVLVGLPTLIDRTVDEQVVTAEEVGVTELASGQFAPIAHPGQGTATILTNPDGTSVLTFTGFETDPGPDLRVYLAEGDPATGAELGDFVDLGALKGNVGDQQYVIGADVDLSRFTSVVVWCRAFEVGFTSATLAG
jgi:hypothetical protein